MKILKRIAIAIACTLVLVGVYAYIQLDRYGLLPREDYDTTPPAIQPLQRPAVLVLDKTNRFIHTEAIPAANDLLRQLADRNGWDIVITANGASHTAEFIQQFDLVIWNNVTGDVLTEDQRQAFRQWITNGGGWVGLHGAGDNSHSWTWYVENLIGSNFIGHTLHPQFQDALLYVSDNSSPITRHLPSPWKIEQEEWYAFDSNPRDRGFEVLITIDENSYHTAGKSWFGYNDRMQGEHPMVWRKNIGSGRVFYSAIGHQATIYRLPEFQELIENAMRWAIRQQDGNSP